MIDARSPSPARKPPAQATRHARVAAGLAELERWLADQIRLGLGQAGDRECDELAKRLIDAQASGPAAVASRLPAVRAGASWPEALLGEYALLALLAVAYRRREALPAPLAQTVLTRVGFTTSRESVLAAGARVRDRWLVLGVRDEVLDQVTGRHVWLRGCGTSRAAVLLTYTPHGQALAAAPVAGSDMDATLAFYPGAAPLRALVVPSPEAGPVTGPPSPEAGPGDEAEAGVPGAPVGTAPAGFSSPVGLSPVAAGSVDDALAEVAEAVAADPWTDSWPLLLAGVVPERTTLGGLPLHPACVEPWRLIAVSGGEAVTVAVEWTPQGLRPLTVWDDEGRAVVL
ncbi:SWIM zinc finger family protein [Nonomuraea typhae]|uniref:SWIM zinc finger family protein n=1 Tax=Nonomuraea typhae TaxID=2603600 RepID=UPI0012FA68A7|nr:SWIM zinc finger family protein [Nonomuraea typhae]